MKSKSIFARTMCLFLILSVMLSGASKSVAKAAGSEDIGQSSYSRDNTYTAYLNKYSDKTKPVVSIKVEAVDYKANDDAEAVKLDNYNGKSQVLEWAKDGGSLSWEINVEEDGLYSVSLEYCSLPGKYTQSEIALMTDGKIPYSNASRIVLSGAWKDETKINKDKNGNDIRPKEIQDYVWLKDFLKDKEGRYNEPLSFYLSKGTHTITIEAIRAGFALKTIEIGNNPQLPAYAEAKNNCDNEGAKDTKGFKKNFQAEKPVLKSDSTLYPMYDRTSPATEPAHPSKMRYNTIGQYNWQYPGQWIEWEIEVPEDGYYTMSFRARQNYLLGMSASRRMYIDGKVPFKELDTVNFPYSDNWYVKTLGGSKPYKIYLTEGKHRIRLEAIPGEIAETVRILDDAIYRLNLFYRKMIMITSTNPDPYRDYDLNREIPGLIDNFKDISNILDKEKGRLEKLVAKKGSEANVMERTSELLKSFVEKPETITQRYDVYKSYVSSLSSFMTESSAQPLELDYITVMSPGQKAPKADVGFFKKLIFYIKSFIGSFFEDYNVLDEDKNKEALVVWVNSGREQAQIIKDLVDSYFVPQTHIPVSINLVQGGLLEATLAGKGPDVGLFISGDLAVNLAMRGALTDLSKFDNFDEETSRFMPQSLIHYKYLNGIYGVPVTQTFPMMFYRTDILKDMGIENPPQTWEEFYKIIPIIQKNNMEIGMGDMFSTLLLQKGSTYYNKDESKTLFDSEESISAFSEWTEFYTKYDFPLTYDFFNRFRTGEMPVGISGYTTYNQLAIAAPELNGLWQMVPLPGTVQSDGSINRATRSDSSGAIVFNKSDKKEKAAWEFINWFTNADIQVTYGKALEALMGPAARYNPSNMQALGMLPWSKQETDLLMNQWKDLREIPNIPAAYEVNRDITNAFRKVVYDHANPRETLTWYNGLINEEIKRKRKEFGIGN